MIRKLFLIFIGMLLLCGCASATDYYVSPTGDNGAVGDIDHPWQNISYAATQATAGDTIYLREGTWNETVTFANSGTAESRITVVNYPGESPEIKGTSYTDGSTYTEGAVITIWKDYITVSGLTIRDKNYQYAYDVRGTHNILENITVNNIGDSNHGYAVYFHGSHNSLLNSTTTETGWNQIQIGMYGVVNTTDITIQNCNISHSRAHGLIDIINDVNPQYVQNVLIDNCSFAAYPGQTCIAAHGTPTYIDNITIEDCTFNTGTYGIDSSLFRYSLIKNNIFQNFTTYALGSGSTGLKLGTVFQNNSILDNSGTYFIGVAGTNVYFIDENLSKIKFKYAPVNISNHQKSSWQYESIYGNLAEINYTDGTVFTISTPSSSTYYNLSAVSYTPEKSYCYLDSGTTRDVTFTVSAYDYSAKPATGTATITPRTPVGSEICNFAAESTNENAVTFVLWGLTPGYQYRINEDGSQKSTQLANESGMISWVNSAWSEHVYTVEDTGLRLPVCAFTANATDGTAPKTIQFTDASTQSPETWSWDFNGDDVEDSTEQNPVWTYDTDGSYDVSLTVTNAIGSDTETKIDYIILTNPYVAPIILTTVAAALLFMRARRRW